MILSDDLAFRGYIKNEHSIPAIWTQAILRFLLDSNKLSSNEYQEQVIQLTGLNYYHTAIDTLTLFTAAYKAKLLYQPPFNHCLSLLKGTISSEYSSLLIGFGFLCRGILQTLQNFEYLIRLKAKSDSSNIIIIGFANIFGFKWLTGKKHLIYLMILTSLDLS